MLAAVDWGLWGTLAGGAAAAAAIYGVWLTRGRWLAQQRNIKLVVTPVHHPVPTPSGTVNVLLLRIDVYNKSSSDIGVHSWTVSAPQGWTIQAQSIKTPWPSPALPQTLRGKHSARWDSPLVAALQPGWPAPPPGAQVVGIHLTFEFGDESTLTVGPLQVPILVSSLPASRPPASQPPASQPRPISSTLSPRARAAIQQAAERARQRGQGRAG
jgi:hypothetical protein